VKRRLFNLAAAVSLVLCLASLALQVRSYWALDCTVRGSRRLSIGLQTSKGEWMVMVYTPAVPPVIDDGLVNWQHWSGLATPMGFDRTTYGKTMRYSDLRIMQLQWGMGPNGTYLRVMLTSGWLFVALFTLVPAVRLLFWLRSAPPKPNCCPTCGYDLRATPQEGGALLHRCPECGAIPSDVNAVCEPISR
jgi:hypothetical protein